MSFGARDFSLMLVTQPCPDLARRVADAVRGGVDIVQLRDKDASVDDLRAIGKELRQAVPPPAKLIVNGSLSVAVEIGADGVHFAEGTDGAIIADALRANMLVGVSVHSVDAARNAAANGAHYLIAGTIFASSSHPGHQPAGLSLLADICRAVTIPVFAIGGVTPDCVGACRGAGAKGVAVLSAILHADDVFEAAQSYRNAIVSACGRRI